jgi:hypothetical protein
MGIPISYKTKACKMRPYKFIEGVELIVPAGSTNVGLVNFPDIPELRCDDEKNVLIRSIRVFPNEVLPQTFSHNTTATLAQIQNAFLTLYMDGMNQVYRTPLIQFVNDYNNLAAGVWSNDVVQVDDWKIDWTKSYLQFPNPVTTVNNLSFFFSIGYIKCPPGTWKKAKDMEQAALSNGIISK